MPTFSKVIKIIGETDENEMIQMVRKGEDLFLNIGDANYQLSKRNLQQDDKQIDTVKYAIEIVSILKSKNIRIKPNQPELPPISDDQSAGPKYDELSFIIQEIFIQDLSDKKEQQEKEFVRQKKRISAQNRKAVNQLESKYTPVDISLLPTGKIKTTSFRVVPTRFSTSSRDGENEPESKKINNVSVVKLQKKHDIDFESEEWERLVREFKQKLLDEEKEKNIRKETPEEFYARVGRLVNSSQIVKANLVLKQVGFLGDLGYKVGAHGLPKRQRQEILEQALFLENIPIDHDDGSMPGSKQRFKKITNSLQWLINSKKGMKNDAYQYSIKDWQDDLNWFVDKFD